MDRALLRRVLVDLRVSCDDADEVAQDMLRPPRKRTLGPVSHRASYDEARGNIVKSIDYLVKLAADDETPRDPSGNGGSGPAH